MNNTEDARKCSLAEEEALKRGLENRSQKFIWNGVRDYTSV